ncbi:uncharacterized protein LOC123617846 [Camelus bactrianus]|uniref:Uncharacterized protein LOC123617846 n=1 Tax=Camelus bactrianus TaxID=9837 RepID=A0AC58PVP3_CAMBA
MPGLFRRAPPLPPSRGSGTPPSANLDSPRPSSSSEACLASSRPGSPFRLPLLVLTRASGRRRSSLGTVRLWQPPEAGPKGPGTRGEGGVCGSRTAARARSHRGLNKEDGGCCACARRRGDGLAASGKLAGRRPRSSGLGPGGREPPRWTTGLQAVARELPPGAAMGAAPSGPLLGAGSRASAPASSRTLSARPASGGLGCPELGSAFRSKSRRRSPRDRELPLRGGTSVRRRLVVRNASRPCACAPARLIFTTRC